MNKLTYTALSTACLLALSGGAFAAMTKAEHAAATTDISAAHTAEIAACKPMKGNSRDVCTKQAKGRESIAKAQLESDFAPTAKTRYDLSVAKADAAYSVAKEKCEAFAGDTKANCIGEAKLRFGQS